MSGIGGQNPIPTDIGGGSSIEEDIYEGLKDVLGQGWFAPNEDGIDGLWRWARACGMAVGDAFEVLAAMQAFPQHATCHLPVYEALLGIVALEGQSEEDRRRIVVAEFTRRLSAVIADISAELLKIDARFSIIPVDHDRTTTTYPGRTMAPRATTTNPVWGLGTASNYPNYSSEFVVTVLFDLGYAGAPNGADQIIMAATRTVLFSLLPSWMTAQFTISSSGFILDSSPLDVTAVR